jgi:hypothetical protein
MKNVSVSLAAIREENPNAPSVTLSPDMVVCLRQIRRQIDEAALEELMLSTLSQGQLNQGEVAALTPIQAAQYVEYIGELWNEPQDIRSYQPVTIDGQEYYLFVIAGHRRYTVCKLLNERVVSGAVTWTPRYTGKFRARLRFDITAQEAISIQFQENTYTRPPAHEEAFAAWCVYRTEEKYGRPMTIERLARFLGRSETWVRAALRFARLPEQIRALANPYTEGAYVTYGVVAEIARLAEQIEAITGSAPSHADLLRFVNLALLERWSTTKARTWVSAYIASVRQTHYSQQDLFSAENDGTDRRSHRGIFERTLVIYLAQQIHLIRAVIAHDENGGFGDDSPFDFTKSDLSPGGALAVLSRALSVYEAMGGRLVQVAHRHGRYRRRVAHALDRGVSALQRGIGDLLNDAD